MIRKVLMTSLVCLMLLLSHSQHSTARMRIHYNTPYELWPSRLQGAQDDMTLELGFIDVTRAPYYAVGDGETDDTIALKQAIHDAYIANLAIYLPADTIYLVSDTLLLKSTAPSDLNLGIHHTSSRKFAHMVYGGTDGERPIIRLKDGRPDNAYNTVLYYEGFDAEKTGSLYASTVKNVHIDMGNNPNWSGVSLDGAQICSLSQVSVSGESFFAGLKNVPGNGTNVSNIEVVGGQYGIYEEPNRARPSITMEDIYLIDQELAGFHMGSSKGGTTITGFEITNSNPSPTYRAIQLERNWSKTVHPTVSSLSMKDGWIDAGIGTGIYSENPMFYVENVYVRAATLIEHGALPTVDGDVSEWNQIVSYAYGSNLDQTVYYNQINDSVEHVTATEETVFESDIQYDVTPSVTPEALRMKHSYDADTFPTLSSEHVNIVDYGATRDDESDDDAGPIQAAIDDVLDSSSPNYGKAVFIPRGHFHIRSTIVLHSGLRMFGAAKTISVLHFDYRWDIDGFTVGIDTDDDPDGSLVLSEFAILGLRTDTTTDVAYGGYSNETHKYMTLFRLRTNNSMIRDLQITRVEGGGIEYQYYEAPMNLITGNAGGKVFGTFAYDTGTFTNKGNLKGDFRIHLFLDTHNPLSIYGINGVHSFQRADGANIEVRGCENLDLYSLKTESVNSFLRIVDSNNINIYGKSGTSYVDDKYVQGSVLIHNSNNIKITNYSHDGLLGLFGALQPDSNVITNFETDGTMHRVSDEVQPIIVYRYQMDELPDNQTPPNVLEEIVHDDTLANLTSPVDLELDSDIMYTEQYGYHVFNRNDDTDTIHADVSSVLANNRTIQHTFSVKFRTDFSGFSDLPETMIMYLDVVLNDTTEERIEIGRITLEQESNAKQENEGKLLNLWFKIMGTVEREYTQDITSATITFEFGDPFVDLYFDQLVMTEGGLSWMHLADGSDVTEYGRTPFEMPVCSDDETLEQFHCVSNPVEDPVCDDNQELVNGECVDIEDPVDDPEEPETGCFGTVSWLPITIAIVAIGVGALQLIYKEKQIHHNQ